MKSAIAPFALLVLASCSSTPGSDDSGLDGAGFRSFTVLLTGSVSGRLEPCG